MSFRPGTVSKILWHFTGGPLWDEITNKQQKELKPAKSGYDALNAILTSKELKVGNYHEMVKVIVPQKRIFNIATGKFENVRNHPVEVKSSPVCCVADIPLQHLSYHANRYGKIAIGFHREAIVLAGFNPVMYTLESTALLNSLYSGYTAIDDTNTDDASTELEIFSNEVEDLFDTYDINESINSYGVEMALNYISDASQTIDEGYKKLLAHIKTFDESEFDSIYCEREWRSTTPFKFRTEDIAIIVLPKNHDGFNYYDDFLSKTKLPRKITIAAWEDLIEH